ncbi:MAG TPA: hypothetical protein PKW42_03285 [bacterium]|nr:hypothetical protein [bacterium]HPP11736.1 hypothetical protein [bacterium]
MRRKSLPGFGDAPVFFLVVAVLLLVFVLLFSELIDCGYEIEEARKRYQELLTENQVYQAEILQASALPAVQQRMKEYGLPLQIPEKWSWLKFDFSRETEEQKKP